MRNLTPKEIDDAPGWAVSYYIGTRLSYHERHFGYTLPLPARKPFDIEPYKHWCDPIFDDTCDNEYSRYALIFRKKAIEIAKHYNLTAADLKQ